MPPDAPLRRPRERGIALLVGAGALLAALLAFSSCQGDECRLGEAKCEGRQALNCEPGIEDPDLRFTGPACGERLCVIASRDGTDIALCALESEPNPACGGDWFFDRVCVGPTLTECSRGFIVAEENCGDSTLCEDSIGSCVVQAGPDPVCEAALHEFSFATLCHGDTLVKCDGDFRIEQEECGPGLCYDGEPFPSCILSATPDPRCEEHFDPMMASSFCDGNTLLKCDANFLIEEQDCGSATCKKFEGNAFAECWSV